MKKKFRYRLFRNKFRNHLQKLFPLYFVFYLVSFELSFFVPAFTEYIFWPAFHFFFLFLTFLFCAFFLTEKKNAKYLRTQRDFFRRLISLFLPISTSVIFLLLVVSLFFLASHQPMRSEQLAVYAFSLFVITVLTEILVPDGQMK